jgi:RHS repeat-associated protein
MLPLWAHAVTIVLQDGLNGYSGTRDTSIKSGNDSNINYGSDNELKIDPNQRTILVRFAIFASQGGPIPNGATINSATLSLYKYTTEPYTMNSEARRLLRDWQELEATWNRANTATAWTTPGAFAVNSDILATADSAVTISWSQNIWIDFNVTAGVQSFAAGAANYGWRIPGFTALGGTRKFYSRERVNAAQRPKLTIDYTPNTPNTPPVVSMTSPTNGAVFAAPGSMTLTATASDSDGTISKVEFFHGGTNLIATVTSSPYTNNWTGVAAGSYNVTAKATDNLNGATTSSPVAVTVTNPPTVNITSPAGGAIFSAPGSVTLTATASDTDGIQKVEFFHGGTNLIATVTSSPYTYNWTGVAAGTYSLTAKATDNLGVPTTSSPVSITVSVPAVLYFIHPDHLNTPRAIYNDQQQLAWRWDQQEPFGNSPPNENPSGLGTCEINLRFPGQYFDKETNLAYNYFRDFDPGLGRYAQSDPIGLGGGLNTYAYVYGQPLRKIDPKGLASCIFYISSGLLVCDPSDPANSRVVIRVASGNNADGQPCKNNPGCTNLANRGPIPQGVWQWTSGFTAKPNGRVLEPMSGTETYGRSQFRTHSCVNAFGPSTNAPYCSEGCITGSRDDIRTLNNLLDAEPGSTVLVVD